MSMQGLAQELGAVELTGNNVGLATAASPS